MMYERILVPLDGSKLAESALPYVEELAQHCGTREVILVSVTERIKGRGAIPEYGYPGTPRADAPISDREKDTREVPVGVGKMQRQSDRYLSRIAKKLEAKGIKTKTETLLGDPAEEIVIFAELRNIDLIAMSSHGRSGISRWAHGSVADRVFRSVNVPVLMVRALGASSGT